MSGTGGAAGAGGSPDDECAPQALVPRRIVRLTSRQMVNSVGALVGAEFAAGIAATEKLPPPSARAFPPLAAEGPELGSSDFDLVDRVGKVVGEHVLAEFDSVTGCGASPTEECGQAFVASFAEKAFRRRLEAPERESLITVYTEIREVGGTIQEAVQHGVWAVLHSPYFLYRTEFGEGDATASGVPLSSYEMASQLAYFLTDAPPDEALLGAASRGELADPDDLGRQARRLIETPVGRANLVAAMMSYFGLSAVPLVIIEPSSVPGLTVTSELSEAMLREGELFFERTLFDASLDELLTSRRAFVNEPLAVSIYGVPPPATGLDADGFGPVELPLERAGLLTSAPFLTRLSRPPTGTSVVSRGLAVLSQVLCQMQPPFPEDGPLDPDPIVLQESWSERQKAEYRATDERCRACHAQFDPFGLALDVFDGVGRVRTTDLQGRPIDAAVTLPALLGERRVASAAEMAAVIAESGLWTACMAMNYAQYALADVTQGGPRAPLPHPPASGCEVRDIVDAFEAGSDPSFGGLLDAIVRSRLLRLRSGSDP